MIRLNVRKKREHSQVADWLDAPTLLRGDGLLYCAHHLPGFSLYDQLTKTVMKEYKSREFDSCPDYRLSSMAAQRTDEYR